MLSLCYYVITKYGRRGAGQTSAPLDMEYDNNIAVYSKGKSLSAAMSPYLHSSTFNMNHNITLYP